MNTKHKYYDVIVAWAEGKPIQVKYVTDSNWKDFANLGSPDFASVTWDWRIKPEMKKFRVALLYSWPVAVEHQEDAVQIENHVDFVRWLTDWIEYEE